MEPPLRCRGWTNGLGRCSRHNSSPVHHYDHQADVLATLIRVIHAVAVGDLRFRLWLIIRNVHGHVWPRMTATTTTTTTTNTTTTTTTTTTATTTTTTTTTTT
jgi:hypothetical protein